MKLGYNIGVQPFVSTVEHGIYKSERANEGTFSPLQQKLFK
jgi:hypothetical protein